MSYLIEAFKALNALDEDVFSVSDDGIEKLSAFEDDDTVSDDITIYDVDAEDESELEDSYIGKVILDCNVCHSKLYKDKADVVIDDESGNANIDMECPYCYSVDGFKVIGEVAPMTTETEETTEDEVTSEDSNVENLETSEMKESAISSANNGETLKEDCQTALEDGDVENTLEEAAEEKYVIRSGVSDANPYTLEYSRKTGKHFGYLGNGGRSWVSADSKGIMTFDSSDEASAFAKEHVKDKYKAEIVKVTGPLEEDWRDGLPLVKEFEKQLVERIPDFKLDGVRDMLYYIKDDFRLWDSLEDDGSAKIDLEDMTKSSERFIYRATIKSVDEIPPVVDEIEKLVNNDLHESAEDNLGVDLDKYQKWVDYDMQKYHKISNKTNNEIRRAGLQIVKDKYGAYQVIAGKYDESLKESVKDVTITTDDSRTTMTSEDNGKVIVTTEPIETPDVDAAVLAPVSDETEMEIEENSADDMDAEIEDIDSDSFEESLSSALKEQYDNVKSYKMSSCSFGNNAVTVNGVIEFASGKKGNAQIKLESHTIDKNGNTTFLTESSKLFSTSCLVSGNLKDKKFITESVQVMKEK